MPRALRELAAILQYRYSQTRNLKAALGLRALRDGPSQVKSPAQLRPWPATLEIGRGGSASKAATREYPAAPAKVRG